MYWTCVGMLAVWGARFTESKCTLTGIFTNCWTITPGRSEWCWRHLWTGREESASPGSWMPSWAIWSMHCRTTDVLLGRWKERPSQEDWCTRPVGVPGGVCWLGGLAIHQESDGLHRQTAVLAWCPCDLQANQENLAVSQAGKGWTQKICWCHVASTVCCAYVVNGQVYIDTMKYSVQTCVGKHSCCCPLRHLGKYNADHPGCSRSWSCLPSPAIILPCTESWLRYVGILVVNESAWRKPDIK